MNPQAPITWLISRIDALVFNSTLTAAQALSSKIMPIVFLGFMVYVMLICFNYLRGAEDNFVGDMLYRFVMFAIVMTVGITYPAYSTIVYPFAKGLGDSFASGLISTSAGANDLDSLAIFYLNIVTESFDQISFWDKVTSPVTPIMLVFKSILLVGCLVPFLVAATIVIIVAKIGTSLVLMVGPLFVSFLLFPATRQWFSSWLNAVFSYSLIPLLVAAVSSISIGISKEIFGNTPLTDISLKLVFFASICNLILVYVARMVSGLASSLSAGGINIGSTGGLGSAAQALNPSRQTRKELKAAGSAAASAASKIANKLRGQGGDISPNKPG
jgi:type IV secretion system protein VirB6